MTRKKVLEMLSKKSCNSPLTAIQLSRTLDVNYDTVSRPLLKMLNEGLIGGVATGNPWKCYYWVNERGELK